MHHSKLIHYLKILDSVELKRLLPFLKSPFYNTSPHIVKLYRILREDHPDFTSPKLAKERVFKKLFPSRDYDHQKLLNLMSEFTALLKKYLQVLQLEKEELLQDELLLRTYAERPKCYDRFAKQLQKTSGRMDSLPYRNADFYRQKFQLAQLYLHHPSTDPFQLSKQEYDEAMQHLDRWFLLEKLLLSCEMKAREKPLAESYKIWLLPELREGIVRYPIESPIAESYLMMMNLMEKGEESSFFKLKDLFLKNLPQFTRRQQQDILQILINFTIQRGNRGEKDFVRENLELYQFGLTEKLFLEYGILNDITYINIINIALRMNESGWCMQFMQKYEPFLDASARKDASSLATALWHYAKQQSSDAIDLLQKVDFRNVYYQIQARALLLKVYFETFQKDDTYFELVAAQAESFERYLRRNETVSKAQRKALLNFANAVRRLAKLKANPGIGGETKARLRRELEELAPLYNKKWLLERVGGV